MTPSLPHGDVALCHEMSARLGLSGMLGPACRTWDVGLALVISSVVGPCSKLSPMSWWADSTLGVDVDVAGAGKDDVVYGVLDWLEGRQTDIGRYFAARYLTGGEIVMVELS